MLSTKALYFVLDDTIGEGAEQTGMASLFLIK